VRTAHSIIAEPWFPAPVDLSVRVRRWIEHEIDEAVATRAPRRTERKDEPAELVRSRGARATASQGAA